MRKRIEIQRFAQVTIILVCTIVVAYQFSVTTSTAQACWPNEPPLTNSTNPQNEAWPQGANISVVVFDRSDTQPTSQDEFNAINVGIKDWNSVSISGCSNVTYSDATRANRGWGGQSVDVPPTNTIYVVRTTDRNGQFLPIYSGGRVKSAWLYMRADFNHQTTDVHSRVDNLAKHEVGHGYGLQNGTFGAPPAVMGQNSVVNGNYVITECDIGGHKRVYCPAIPTPTPTPTPEDPWSCQYQTLERPYDPSGYGELDCSLCQDATDNDCDGYIDLEEWDCLDCTSPVVIDTLGNGIDLTSPTAGVEFDISGSGKRMRFSWIQADDAFLTLDRNGNGTVDNGKELFGAVTYQPSGSGRNGFRALAIYDMPNNGGNQDGVIDYQDTVFTNLRLWLDSNHNGISEQNELHDLPSLNVINLDLDYRESRQTDSNGNAFRFRAKVRDVGGANVGRWAWDIFLAHERQVSQNFVGPSIPKLFASETVTFDFRKTKCRGAGIKSA